MLGTRPPDDLARPSAYVLTVATFGTGYVGIFEIDNQPITSLRGRYRPGSGTLDPADNYPVVIEDNVDIRCCHAGRLPFLHCGL